MRSETEINGAEAEVTLTTLAFTGVTLVNGGEFLKCLKGGVEKAGEERKVCERKEWRKVEAVIPGKDLQ